MTKFIIGKKLGMSQLFDAQGRAIPVTVVEASPNVVVQVKNIEKDGYEAIQLGTGKKKNLSKALKGHFKNLGNFAFSKEVRGLKVADKELKVGDRVGLEMFSLGDIVKVSGISKGKGFQGAIKRHGFHGMPASHGHFAVQRHIGSIGQRFPQHTLKGKRMAGHMGNERVTVRGLKVVLIDAENQLLALKGNVPGNNGSFLEIAAIK